MISLVGFTGFVGSNLAASAQFDGLYNSKNVQEAFGTCPDILYYSGVPAQKFLANKFPQEDFKAIETAMDNIKKINPKKIVLISTIDVYQDPSQKDETAYMDKENLEPYGKNRLYLEEYVKQNFKDYLIVRLPGLYGKNLKKNFIYDFIQFVPAMLSQTKMQELAAKKPQLLQAYTLQENGFYQLNPQTQIKKLKPIFEELGFCALHFTDSRGKFQFYNLKYLYQDIQTALQNNIQVLNIATQPVLISQIYHTLTGKDFVNHIAQTPPNYDFRTCHEAVFGGSNGYLQDAQFVLQDIKNYVKEAL